MKICIFGAGAIGGYLAVELALAGHEVCAIARGDHLQAIHERGLTLLTCGQVKTARIPASDSPADFGTQDLVICALKAHQAYESAAAFAPLLASETPVVAAMNGFPWWYFYEAGGDLAGCSLEAVDPGGRQWNLIGPERAVGCVVDPACEVVAPGVVQHREFRRFLLGEPDGSRSPRIVEIAQALTDAGFDAPIRDGIRSHVWLKLWGNVCFNPLSALTLATVDRIVAEPALRSVCVAMMREARAVAGALGIRIPEAMIKRRLAAALAMTEHKMSMLQDLERGRPLEIDALVTAVVELGRLTGVPTPTIEVGLALVRERGRQAGLYVPLDAGTGPHQGLAVSRRSYTGASKF
ncbi:MAG TPA: 2-dehydropantoate 2-reductase [Geminicoccaceae bacterium]|nr:2-dehydropantoate 2-reductase [Geminicoccaceae bacterium]